ncbi:MAG TPA: diguanylate cyclase [Candidatus Limnocylindria bacterium]|nr:diguanylate cyclase [Candidatus Limnocylindria bacterium]
MTGDVDRLGSLARLARSLVAARSEAEVARVSAAEARFAFGADAASVGRLEPERGLVRTLVNAGDLAAWETEEPVDETYRLADFPLLAVMVEDVQPWVLSTADPAGSPEGHALLTALGRHSGLAVPVLLDGVVWGELFVSRGGDTAAFDVRDVDFGVAFAGLVSAGLGQVEHNERVRRLAYSDSLTGLGNRRFIEERLDEALSAHRRDRRPVSLVMADVNGLKAANDRNQSHADGDAALRAVASALSRATSRAPGSVAGRIGGDEFCAVVAGGLAVAESLAVEFHALAARAPHIRGVAVGIATTELAQGPVGREQLLAWADEAQYVAKAAGSVRPVVAGRDAEGQPFERRRWRGSAGADLLPRGLALLGELRALPTAQRLSALAALLAEEWGATGWVVSTVRDGVGVPVSWPHGQTVTGHAFPVPAAEVWVQQARVHGVELLAEDEETPLADVRGVARVGVVAANGWLLELHGTGSTTFLGVLPSARALAAVAVLG